MTPSPQGARTAHTLTWLIVVAAPLATAAAAWVWIELCKALFIPGMFLALPAFLMQMILAAYAAPLRWLAPGLCYVDKGVVTGLPCDAGTWLALAALYTLASLGLVAAALRLRALRRQ